MSEELKPWRCKNGHVMGMVRRNGSGVRVLLLYREALTPGLPSPLDTLAPRAGAAGAGPLPEGRGEQEVDVMAVVEGYVADVRCSICGDVRTWVPGEEALRALIKRAQRLQAA